MSRDGALIICRNLKKTYPSTSVGEAPLELAFPDICIPAGRRIALLGVSGSGKSTFLNLVAGLDEPDRDPNALPTITYSFSDRTQADIADRNKKFPRERLGFVFQEGHLITDASAGVNAALPGLLNGIAATDEELQRFMDALQLPPDTLTREAWRLSGGQKQRVAILRALFHAPEVIFADEPTSSVDALTAASIMRLLVTVQEQDPGRTLFWATHDLRLASKFATDFLVVRKLPNQPVELEGPIPNTGQNVAERVYLGIDHHGKPPVIPVRCVERKPDAREIAYTQGKVGTSLTFARRNSQHSFSRLGPFGKWMASIQSIRPPLLAIIPNLFRLYRRFSDFAVAAALGLPVLMLSSVFVGLWTMGTVREQAMSDSTACHVVASAPDAETGSGRNVILDAVRLAELNRTATWRTPRQTAESGGAPATAANPCGEAETLVFGRNTVSTDLGIPVGQKCERLDNSPKTLVARLNEPAISHGIQGARTTGGKLQTLGEMTGSRGSIDLNALSGLPLTGSELFISFALREGIEKKARELGLIGTTPSGISDLTKLDLCVDGRSTPSPPRIGAVVQSLPYPQPRGTLYDLLVMPSPLFMPSDDGTFQQAVFYTHPERAEDLEKFLIDRGFTFSREDLQRMISTSKRFSAIKVLISVVGFIVTAAALFFLLTGVQAFMEKNARPNAVLRAYGLSESKLRRQIFWRLAAVAPYSMLWFGGLVAVLGATFPFLFSAMGLPLPSLTALVAIIAAAFLMTGLLSAAIVFLSVRLWWRKHGNIAQELG